jgi:acyl carrier protein
VTESDQSLDNGAGCKDWVSRYLARLLGIDPWNIDFSKGLSEYGLDSVDVMIMAGEFEQRFGVEIDPATFFELDTLEQMVDALGKITVAVHHNPS